MVAIHFSDYLDVVEFGVVVTTLCWQSQRVAANTVCILIDLLTAL